MMTWERGISTDTIFYNNFGILPRGDFMRNPQWEEVYMTGGSMNRVAAIQQNLILFDICYLRQRGRILEDMMEGVTSPSKHPLRN